MMRRFFILTVRIVPGKFMFILIPFMIIGIKVMIAGIVAATLIMIFPARFMAIPISLFQIFTVILIENIRGQPV